MAATPRRAGISRALPSPMSSPLAPVSSPLASGASTGLATTTHLDGRGARSVARLLAGQHEVALGEGGLDKRGDDADDEEEALEEAVTLVKGGLRVQRHRIGGDVDRVVPERWAARGSEGHMVGQPRAATRGDARARTADQRKGAERRRG